jgi:hypothetical protein
MRPCTARHRRRPSRRRSRDQTWQPHGSDAHLGHARLVRRRTSVSPATHDGSVCAHRQLHAYPIAA